MSDRWPGHERARRDDPRESQGPDWLEHEGASVFSSPPPPPPPRPPAPRRPPPPRADPWGTPPPPRPAPPPTREAPPPTRPYPTAYQSGPDTWGPPPAPGWADPAPYPPGGPGPGGDVDPGPRPPPRGAPSRPGRGATRTGGFRSPIGLGALIGVAGAVAFVAALVVLPWFTVADQDVTLPDLRAAFTVPATDPGSLPGAGGPDATLPDGQIPTSDDLAAVVEDQVRDAAATAAAQAIDDGKARYLELYVDTLWLPVAAVVAVAALVSTLLAPRSTALSVLLGVRRLAGSLVVLAALAHAAALWIVFTGAGAPTPDTGVWIGVAGLVGVLAGCVIGPRG